MGRRNKGDKKQKKADQSADVRSDRNQADPIKTAIALHPQLSYVALAVGSSVRILDTTSNALIELPQPEGVEPAIVRSIAFDPTGRFFALGGDSKCFQLYDCSSWSLVKTKRAAKKISSVMFTNNGEALLAADKFGDVFVTRTTPSSASDKDDGPDILLGHYCSIITSLSMSRNGKYMASTDRDNRIRVSIIPEAKYITQGAPEIQSYCFGHTEFVACATFVQNGDAELLVSGGGDARIMLWDPITGDLLDTIESGSTGADERDAVLSVVATQTGGVVAAIDKRPELLFITIDWQARKFSEPNAFTLQGMPAPTELAVDNRGRVWVAGGPHSETSPVAFLACGTLSVDADGSGRLADDTLGFLSDANQKLLTANTEGITAMASDAYSFIPYFLKMNKKRHAPDAGDADDNKKARQDEEEEES